jgi:purine-nucleoside phosphorylase
MKNIPQALINNSWASNKSAKVLIMGLCGSLTKQYSIGDLVLYQNCGNLAGEKINLDLELTTKIQQKLALDLVTGLTSDRVIAQAREKLKLSHSYAATVVDMEGYEYIQQLQQQEVSVAMLRVVSDDLTGDIPNLSSAIDDSGNLKTIPMAIAFLKQPIAAMRLIKGSLRGLKILEQVTYQLTSNN